MAITIGSSSYGGLEFSWGVCHDFLRPHSACRLSRAHSLLVLSPHWFWNGVPSREPCCSMPWSISVLPCPHLLPPVSRRGTNHKPLTSGHLALPDFLWVVTSYLTHSFMYLCRLLSPKSKEHQSCSRLLSVHLAACCVDESLRLLINGSALVRDWARKH